MSKPIQQGITFFKNDVEIIARETLYRGFFHSIYTVFATACLTAA